MKTNGAGIELIKFFESCRLSAYQDSVGVWTCGWGQTGADIGEGTMWTQEYADSRFQDSLEKVENGVTQLLAGNEVTPNQFAALVSFVFNLGLLALAHSTLLAKLKGGDVPGAAEEFLKWDHAGGRVLAGLTKRRIAERELFLTA